MNRILMLGLMLAACSPSPASNGQAPDRGADATSPAPRPAPGNAVVIPPNSGTAPDWLATCAGQAHRTFGVGYDAVHVDRQIVDRPDGIRIAEGHYERNGRRIRYRCLVDREDRFLRIETLPPPA